MADIYNLERFKQAQDLGVFDKALKCGTDEKQDTGYGSSSRS